MENRYFYIDAEGHVQGPFWLSIMRDLWRGGRLMMSTEVSLTGLNDWERLEFHPEIFELKAEMPTEKVRPRSKSNPVRLVVWTGVLFIAYIAWVLIHWNDGKRPRVPVQDPPSIGTESEVEVAAAGDTESASETSAE
jgi:hypothetical protein